MQFSWSHIRENMRVSALLKSHSSATWFSGLCNTLTIFKTVFNENDHINYIYSLYLKKYRFKIEKQPFWLTLNAMIVQDITQVNELRKSHFWSVTQMDRTACILSAL